MEKNPRRMAILFFILVPAVILAAILLPRRFLTTETVPPPETETTPQSSVRETISLAPETEDGKMDFAASAEIPAGTQFEADLPGEIGTLFLGYFSAKRSGDAALVYSYFLSRDEETKEQEELEEENRRLLWSMEYIEDYQDITCYGIPGLEEDSYVVYVAYKIKFYQSDVPAPSLSAAYVKKDRDGVFKIWEPGPEDPESAYMEQAERLDAVKALADGVQKEFLDALDQDENLAALCGVIMSGPAESSGAETKAGGD